MFFQPNVSISKNDPVPTGLYLHEYSWAYGIHTDVACFVQMLKQTGSI